MYDPYEHIEPYLKKTLNEEELLRFEEYLSKDPGLQTAISNFPHAQKLAQSLIEIETRNQLQMLRKSSDGSPIKWYILLALLLLSILTSIWYMKEKNKMDEPESPDQMFAALYEAPATQNSRSASELNNIVDSAIYYFDSQLDQNSYHLFSRILSTDSLHVQANRYLGHLELKKKNYKEAYDYFQRVYSINEEPFASEALYLLSVIAFFENDLENARSFFIQLKSRSYFPGQNKMELMEKLLK